MSRSTLFGRRFHIAGSVSEDSSVATEENVLETRKFLELLVTALVKRGATFVVPLDAEPPRADGLPICFDWLVWKVLGECVDLRPPDAVEPMAVAVRHHKSESQVPEELAALWHRLRDSDHVETRNVGHWNMQSIRMDAQAERGDVLVVVGGGDGVLYLANKYHDAGKPVVPLNAVVTSERSGARRLFDDIGMSQFHANRLFRTTSGRAHEWLGRIDFGTAGRSIEERVEQVLSLLEDLDLPQAFVVRLLDKKNSALADVESTFRDVILPVVEEKGYRVTVVDGSQPFSQPTIDRQIFEGLHRAQLVLADLTELRPNCLIELGYALGRGLPTLVSAREEEDVKVPSDIRSVPIYLWRAEDAIEKRRADFREYWGANIRRPPLVPTEGLIE